MKKSIAMVTALVLTLSLSACGGGFGRDFSGGHLDGYEMNQEGRRRRAGKLAPFHNAPERILFFNAIVALSPLFCYTTMRRKACRAFKAPPIRACAKMPEDLNAAADELKIWPPE